MGKSTAEHCWMEGRYPDKTCGDRASRHSTADGGGARDT